MLNKFTLYIFTISLLLLFSWKIKHISLFVKQQDNHLKKLVSIYKYQKNYLDTLIDSHQYQIQLFEKLINKYNIELINKIGITTDKIQNRSKEINHLLEEYELPLINKKLTGIEIDDEFPVHIENDLNFRKTPVKASKIENDIPKLFFTRSEYRHIIIVPPFENYLSGYKAGIDQCNGCSYPIDNNCRKVCETLLRCQNIANTNQSYLLYSDLGKDLYLSMIEGINLFNQRCIKNHKHLTYRLNTGYNVPIANCISNKNISDFYESVKDNTHRLKKNLKSKKSEAIIWLEYQPNFKTAIRECFSTTNCKNRIVEAKLVLFDGETRKQRSVKLKFKNSYKTFSLKSLTILKYSVSTMLYDSKFP